VHVSHRGCLHALYGVRNAIRSICLALSCQSCSNGSSCSEERVAVRGLLQMCCNALHALMQSGRNQCVQQGECIDSEWSQPMCVTRGIVFARVCVCLCLCVCVCVCVSWGPRRPNRGQFELLCSTIYPTHAPQKRFACIELAPRRCFYFAHSFLVRHSCCLAISALDCPLS
jgi:hypothetical protein